MDRDRRARVAEVLDEMLRERFPHILREQPIGTIAEAAADVVAELEDAPRGEALVPVSSTLERERDEVREALREAVGVLKHAQYERGQDAVAAMAVEASCRQVLDGVERTHALVPVTALQRLARIVCEEVSDRFDGELEWTNALDAAARGEMPEWPS